MSRFRGELAFSSCRANVATTFDGDSRRNSLRVLPISFAPDGTTQIDKHKTQTKKCPLTNIMIATPPNVLRRVAMIEGIFDFASSISHWNLVVADSKMDLWPLDGSGSQRSPLSNIDGMIFWPDSFNDQSIQRFTQQDFPSVMICDLFGSLTRPAAASERSLPAVRVNLDRLVARAVSHLQGITLGELALVTSVVNDPLWPPLQKHAADQACPVERWDVSSPRLPRWLCERTNTGILASSDDVARQVSEIARQQGVEVPSHVRIVSAQDSWECALPVHSITAVRHPLREMGFQAARLLRRLIEQKPVPTTPVEIAPTEVCIRQTCASAVPHPAIAQAVQFIRDHAIRGISVGDVMELQETSRVTFERHFREVMDCSPAEMIRQVRADHAKSLLQTTSMSIASVAQSCGFETLASFSTFFKTAVGISPRQYRAKYPDPPDRSDPA